MAQGPHFSPSTHPSASLLGILHLCLQLNDLHTLVWHKALISPPVLTPVPACWASSTCVSSSMIYIPWCGTRPSFLPQYSPQCQPAGHPPPVSPAQWSTYPGVAQGPHFSPSTHPSASLLGLLHLRLQLNDLHTLVWHKALVSPPVLTTVPACWASFTCVSSSMIYISWCDTSSSFLPSTHHSASLLGLLHLCLQLNDLHTLVWHKFLISPPVLTTVPACWASFTCVSSSMIYISWCDTRSSFLPSTHHSASLLGLLHLCLQLNDLHTLVWHKFLISPQYSPQCQPAGPPPPVSPAQWSTYPGVTQVPHFSPVLTTVPACWASFTCVSSSMIYIPWCDTSSSFLPSTHHSASLLGLLHLCLQLNDLHILVWHKFLISPQYSPQCQPAGPPSPVSPAQWSTYPGVTQVPHFSPVLTTVPACWASSTCVSSSMIYIFWCDTSSSFLPSTHHSASLLGLLHLCLQFNDLHTLVWHKFLISPPVLTPVPACWASFTCVSSSMIYISWCDTRSSFLPSTHHSASLLGLLHLCLQLNDLQVGMFQIRLSLLQLLLKAAAWSITSSLRGRKKVISMVECERDIPLKL